MHSLSRFALVALLVFVAGGMAFADSVSFTGTLYSDSYSLGTDYNGTPSDPLFPDTASIDYGNPFSLTLNYDPSQFHQTGNAYALLNATLTGWFGSTSNSISYSSDSTTNNYLAVFNPGPYGYGVSFQFCTASDCINDYINLYFAGSISSLSTMASDVSGLTGDSNASPAEFEFLRNFTAYDGNDTQTDLMGTLDAPSGQSGFPAPVPEPATLTLLASGLAAGWLRRRKH